VQLDLPKKDFVNVDTTGSHKFSAGIRADASELSRSRRSKSSEISVSGCVEGANRSVERRREDDFTVGYVNDAGDGRGVLGEGDKAEAGHDVPQFHLSVLSAGGDSRAVWWRNKNMIVSLFSIILFCQIHGINYLPSKAYCIKHFSKLKKPAYFSM
jgi:hypothetical protein